MMYGFSRKGKRIVGVLELIPATAPLLGRSEDGELIYEGESELTWDAAEPEVQDGQLIFIDEEHNYVLEDEVEWRS